MDVEQPFRARFGAEAQELFDEWRADLERRLREDKLPPHLESHLAKYRSLMPTLALLLHIADGSRDPEVPLIQAQRAADWCDYLEAHAVRVYSSVTGVAARAAESLAQKIKGGKVGTRFTARDVYENGWAWLDNTARAHEAIDALIEAGWLRVVPVLPGTKGGRSTKEYILNPAVLRG
jgi:hypothetical protein